MVKLSIIVPIYKVVQYLCKCVDSLLAQDISASEYEIILVDDGSPDECPQICDSYVDIYGNIRVVHRENGGLSAARNSGIEVAHGEYVMFVDSDDYIEPNVLGGLLAQIEREELDVLRYNFQNVRVVDAAHLEYEVFSPNKAQKRDVDYSESVTDGYDFLNNHLGPMCYAWAFVIRRELFYGIQYILKEADEKYKDILIFAISLLLSISSVYLHRYLCPVLPFSIMQIFVCLPFYVVGWYIHKRPIPGWVYLISVIAWLFANKYGGVALGCCGMKYYPLSFIGACGGTYVVYLVCKGLAYIINNNLVAKELLFPLSWCGVYSLPILCMHEYEMQSGIMYSVMQRFSICYECTWEGGDGHPLRMDCNKNSLFKRNI